MAATRHEIQMARARRMLDSFRRLGFTKEDDYWPSPQELSEGVDASFLFVQTLSELLTEQQTERP